MEMNHDTNTNGHLDFIFLFAATTFHILEGFNFDEVYHVVFQILSLISLCLIIYVNWNKIINRKKNEDNKD